MIPAGSPAFLRSQFHSSTRSIVRCIFLSRNRDNSWHSVSPGNAKPFLFTFRALCWVTWECRGLGARARSPAPGAQSGTRPLRRRSRQSWLRFLGVRSGGGAGLFAACCCRRARPGRDGHGSGQLTSGTAGLWRLGAVCRWHGLPFSGSGGSSEILDYGLWPQQLCSVPTAGGNDGSLFSSLLQKRIWINSKRPLALRFSKITD